MESSLYKREIGKNILKGDKSKFINIAEDKDN
jgi:hypothetical protein